MVTKLPFDSDTKRRVAEAVAAAEAGTSGEIVVVVERRAGRYGDTLAVLSAIGATLLSLLGMSGLPLVSAAAPEWVASTDRGPSPIWGAIVWVAGFAGVWFVFEGIPAALRLFVARSRRTREAEGAAWRVFGQRGVHRTKGRTGVLLYVAEFEKTVAVLGDSAIDAELKPADWEAVRDTILDGYQRKRADEGLLHAIEQAGALLARHFPIAPDDTREIPDDPNLGEGA